MKTKRIQPNITVQKKCEEEKIFFYHSFPKLKDCKDENDQIDKGIKIIESMVERGLILRHEDVPWREYLKRNYISNITQKRVCFTAIEPKKLECHMKIWGPFSLEFDAINIRMLGAMPIFYVPIGTGGETNAKLPAQVLVMRLFYIWNILRFFQSQLEHGIMGLFGLLYPTEPPTADSLLENFRLSEWRITGNTLEVMGVKRELSDNDKRELIKNSLLCENQAANCLKFHKLNGRHVLTYAKRIIVPDNRINDVEKILNSIDKPPEVIAISDFKKDFLGVHLVSK